VDLPASEIGWCGFHGVGVWLVRLEADDGGWFVSVWADGGFTNERVSSQFAPNHHKVFEVLYY
jgi:hypothetical protein